MNVENPSRRDFLKVGATALASAGFGSASLSARSPRSGSGSIRVDNLILIISDTLRRDAVSLFGANWISTPNLDRFAREAVAFDNALVSSFPTVLARNDVLTGRYTFTYKGWQPIDSDDVTLPEILGKAGILTALVADNPNAFTPGFNYQRGFAAWEVTRGQAQDNFRSAPRDVKLPCAPEKCRDNHTVITQYLRNVAHRSREEDYFVAQTMTKAAAWLEENNDGRRFFLYVDTFDPHEPWDPPRYYVDRYDAGYQGEEVIYPRYDRWREFLSESELKHCRALYAGEVRMVDRWIGFLLDRIASLDLLRNTAVIIMSDHGFFLGEHGYIGKALIHGTYQDLPLYPVIARIPMMIYFPGCSGGSRVLAQVQPVDLMPTVLDLLGVAKPPSIESPSLVPLLEGRVTKVKDLAISSPAIYYKTLPPWQLERLPPSPASRSSITDGEWLLIYRPHPGKISGTSYTAAVDSRIRMVENAQGEIHPELYNLKEDPHCENNCLNANHRVATDLCGAYMDFLEAHKVPPSHLKYFVRL